MRFEELDVWKRSSRLCVDIYKELANCRDFGFKDQITRCSLSVPSNIAEGFGRNQLLLQATLTHPCVSNGVQIKIVISSFISQRLLWRITNSNIHRY